MTLKLTKADVRRELDALPAGYKTADLDQIIARLVRQKADVSALRDSILTEQDLHRIYFYVNLKQIRNASNRMAFIHENLLFSDWWHTDQLIHFAAAVPFEEALAYARGYLESADPFIRRWAYVLFIGRLGRGHASALLPLMKNDEEYYVRMGEAWLIAELTIDEPEKVYAWMAANGLHYDINGRAIQKICDSYRISGEWKDRFKALRPALKDKEENRP
ncbi:MAG: DNA alkylation repair protein [Oscillospiraceae bacterium]|nr:DNA alkylation repair protein [Oscillospiraceae bacterium]